MTIIAFLLTWVLAGLIFGWGLGTAARLSDHEDLTSHKEKTK